MRIVIGVNMLALCVWRRRFAVWKGVLARGRLFQSRTGAFSLVTHRPDTLTTMDAMMCAYMYAAYSMMRVCDEWRA